MTNGSRTRFLRPLQSHWPAPPPPRPKAPWPQAGRWGGEARGLPAITQPGVVQISSFTGSLMAVGKEQSEHRERQMAQVRWGGRAGVGPRLEQLGPGLHTTPSPHGPPQGSLRASVEGCRTVAQA